MHATVAGARSPTVDRRKEEIVMRVLVFTVLATLAALAASPVPAQEIRREFAQPNAMLARSVEVPAGARTLWVSGIPSNVPGGTGPQTADVLSKLGVALQAAGYGFGDVVNVKVYLVGDPAKGGAMDFAGMNAEYQKVFGAAAQPARPSRVTVQVAGLAMPGALVEIELTAAKAR